MRSAYRGSIPMPLSSTAKRHADASRVGGHAHVRHRPVWHELDGVGDQVLHQLEELARLARHGRQAVPLDHRRRVGGD